MATVIVAIFSEWFSVSFFNDSENFKPMLGYSKMILFQIEVCGINPENNVNINKKLKSTVKI